MVVFIILVVKGLNAGEGTGTVFSLQPFFVEGMNIPLLITGATILCFSFLGFDAVTTLSEETPNPQKTIPKAIYAYSDMGRSYFYYNIVFYSIIFSRYIKVQ